MFARCARIARELNDIPPQERLGHQLSLPRLHHDDEIGMLVRCYNRNQQSLLRQHDELSLQSTRFPVSELPNKAFLMAMLEQTATRPQPSALLVVACETLQDAAGVLKESQREMLLLTLVEKLKAVIPPQYGADAGERLRFRYFRPRTQQAVGSGVVK